MPAHKKTCKQFQQQFSDPLLFSSYQFITYRLRLPEAYMETVSKVVPS